MANFAIFLRKTLNKGINSNGLFMFNEGLRDLKVILCLNIYVCTYYLK